MLAVGIDVSKAKSTAAVLNSNGEVCVAPFTFKHNHEDLNAFVKYLKEQNEPITILMEYTGHYYYPVLKKFEDEGMPVCMINPYQMKKFGDTNIRKAKTDKQDAIRIATYALEKSYLLKPHSFMEERYDNLRILSRQYLCRMTTLTQNRLHLLTLLDETMPGITTVMQVKSRDPDTSLFLNFVKRFGSFDRILKMGKTRFIESYVKMVNKIGARSPKKGLVIYELAENSITTHGTNEYTIMAQNQCVDLVITSQKAMDEIIQNMQLIAETIPEYKILRGMGGVGDRLGPLILAEIGDVRRFHSAKALNAYAGNDAPPYQSGNFESRNRHISKRGNAALRKYCFEVMQMLKMHKPQNDPVYLFMLKKEQEGKPHKVAMMAAMNKFLRIYYSKVKASGL